jgi:hypothetical protein
MPPCRRPWPETPGTRHTLSDRDAPFCAIAMPKRLIAMPKRVIAMRRFVVIAMGRNG